MADYIDKEVKELIINRLTREEYQELEERGEVHDDEIYLFPDTIQEDLDALKERVDILEEKVDKLDELGSEADDLLALLDEFRELRIEFERIVREVEIQSQLIDSLGSEVDNLYTVIYGKDGRDGLIDKVNDLENKFIVLQPIIENIDNILNLEQRVEELEDKAVLAEESSEYDTDTLIIYGGTSVDVMDDTI